VTSGGQLILVFQRRRGMSERGVVVHQGVASVVQGRAARRQVAALLGAIESQTLRAEMNMWCTAICGVWSAASRSRSSRLARVAQTLQTPDSRLTVTHSDLHPLLQSFAHPPSKSRVWPMWFAVAVVLGVCVALFAVVCYVLSIPSK
jgi:hypothetical protein